VGAALRAAGVAPDLVVCSNARRAQQTWRRAAAALGHPCPVREEPRAYAATAGELLEIVRELPEEAGNVVLVGHNPGIEELATALSGEELTFRTSALAVLGVPGPWATLAPGTAALLAFLVPRG
jgi:phosphohistidine phosphatase